MTDTRPLHLEEDVAEFVRLPGMYRRAEIQLVLRPGCDFHLQPQRVSPGTQLFTVYQQQFTREPPLPATDHAASACGCDGDGDGFDDESPTSLRSSPSDTSQRDEPSLGELRSRHRDEHLCLKCEHHLVCGMAQSLDPNLLVTVAACLGFKPAALDETGICELMPIEPLGHP